MDNIRINNNLFTSSGCLSSNALSKITMGSLPQDQMNLIGKHLQNCAFCSEAVEGLNLHKELDFIQDIAVLKQRWAKRNSKDNKIFERQFILRYSLAACLLGFGLFLAFWINQNAKLKNDTKCVVLPQEIDLYISNADSRIIPFSPKQTAIEKEFSARETFRTKELVDSPKYIARVENAKIITHEYTEVLNSNFDEISQSARVKKTKRNRPFVVITSQPPVNSFELEPISEITKVYSIVDEMPSFNGKGVNEFKKYVYAHIQYPKEALDKEIEGRVYIQFIVDETGKIIEPRILKGCHPLLEKEVLKIINNSPKWKPGKQQNIPVKVYLTLPVDFTLAN